MCILFRLYGIREDIYLSGCIFVQGVFVLRTIVVVFKQIFNEHSPHLIDPPVCCQSGKPLETILCWVMLFCSRANIYFAKANTISYVPPTQHTRIYRWGLKLRFFDGFSGSRVRYRTEHSTTLMRCIQTHSLSFLYSRIFVCCFSENDLTAWWRTSSSDAWLGDIYRHVALGA